MSRLIAACESKERFWEAGGEKQDHFTVRDKIDLFFYQITLAILLNFE